MLENLENEASYNKVYVGLHIPKTGGNTFHKHIAKYYKFNHEFVHFARAGREKSLAQNQTIFEEKPLIERNKCRIIFGHDVTDETINFLPDKVPVYFTFLRQPARFYISFWNYHKNWLQVKRGKKYHDSFESYYEACGVNRMSKLICAHFPSFCDHTDDLYEKTLAVLNKFDYVFLNEYMDQQLVPLFQAWNIPTKMERKNVTGKRFDNLLELDPELEEKLNRENDVDFKIYSEYCQVWGVPVPKMT